MIPPSLLVSSLWKGTHVGLRAAVERGPSEGARSGSTGPTWVPFLSSLPLDAAADTSPLVAVDRLTGEDRIDRGA